MKVIAEESFPELYLIYNRSLWFVWQHCKAAKNVRLYNLYVDSSISVTAEDWKAICHLPNLQIFEFSIGLSQETDVSRPVRELKEHLDFRFEYKQWCMHQNNRMTRTNFLHDYLWIWLLEKWHCLHQFEIAKSQKWNQ